MTILGAELSPLSDSVPVIIEVYDLLSGKHDGTITPWAPIIVSGSRLDMYARDTVRLCLVSATDAKRVIEIGHIYKYSCNKVILALPALEPDMYRHLRYCKKMEAHCFKSYQCCGMFPINESSIDSYLIIINFFKQ